MLQWTEGCTQLLHFQRINSLFLTKDRHKGAEINFQSSKTSLSNSSVIGMNHITRKVTTLKGPILIWMYIYTYMDYLISFITLYSFLVYSEFIDLEDIKLSYFTLWISLFPSSINNKNITKWGEGKRIWILIKLLLALCEYVCSLYTVIN